MLKINKQSITLTKGDDASLRLVPRYKDKTIYTVQEGDSAIFRLKVGASVKELECVINLENNKIVVNFTPADTKDFEPGIYRYEAELITSLGFHYTFIADQPFILGNEIEQRLSNATSANGNSNGNYPEIDGEIGDEPVVNGDIQPTNPMMDYEELNHLPKLNGKTIKGDKDNEYYGIPTKLSEMDNDDNYVQDEDYQHTDNNYGDTDKGKVDALGTASTYDVAESGNASTSQVVKGDDTRLTDARTPVAHQHTKVDITDFPTNVSAFNNDSGYITNAVNTLINYYLKSETYTKTEVEQLIAAIKQGKFEVVETLPANPDPNVIYLVPKDPTQTSNAYDEYVYINNAWEKIGDTDIDLSDYVTDEELTTALQNYVTTSAFQTAIANYYTKTETDNLLSNKVDKVSGKGLSTNDYDNTAKGIVDGVTTALAGKVDKVNGKGLSTEDYTTAEKTKLAAISDEANKVTSSSTNGHINIDGVDTTVYDDTAVTTAISGLNENVEDIQDELSTDTSTVEGNPINFTTKSSQTAQSTIIDLEPIQDLHGYDKPWVGGAGKNKLPLVLANIKTDNTSGTWNGNTYTLSGGKFTVTVDADGNVTSIETGGNASEQANMDIGRNSPFSLPAGTYILSGAPSGSSSGSYDLYVRNMDTNTIIARCYDNSTQTEFTLSGTTNLSVTLRIPSGGTSQKIYYPMIRLSTASADYEPYTNECSISGRTEIGISRYGKNLFDYSTCENKTINNSGLITDANNRLLSQPINVVSGTTYSFSFSRANAIMFAAYAEYDGDTFKQRVIVDSETSPTQFIPTTNKIRLLLRKSSGSASISPSDVSDSQLELGNQSSSFESFQSAYNLTISLGQTVYGGTIDVEKGELVVDKVFDELSGGITAKDSQNKLFVAPLTNTIKSWTGNTPTTYAITNYLGAYTLADLRSSAIFGFCQYSDSVYIRLGESITDISDANTYLSSNPLQVCYKLATPITINLAPNVISLLEGVNNISTTGDKITLTYRDGSVATLGDLTSAVDSLDGKIEDSKILTDTVTGDKYKLVVTSGVLSIEQISN